MNTNPHIAGDVDVPLKDKTFATVAMADMHQHWRVKPTTTAIAASNVAYCDIGVAMPNTEPPIITPESGLEYGQMILDAARPFNPEYRVLTTAYLTDDIPLQALVEGYRQRDDGSRAFYSAKWYPLHGTTNSDRAITKLEHLWPKLAVMEKIGMPLCIHAELVKRKDIEFAPPDRAAAFMTWVWPQVQKRFPALRIIVEHIAGKDEVDAVIDAGPNVVASVTPHHPTINADDLHRNPHWRLGFCQPQVRGESDRRMVRRAMTSGTGKFFAGTDDAPHFDSKKVGDKPSSGCRVHPGAVEAYAAIFDAEGIFDRPDGVEIFSRFLGIDGPVFYGIPPSTNRLVFTPADDVVIDDRIFVPSSIEGEKGEEITPFFHKDLGFAPHFPFRVTRAPPR